MDATVRSVDVAVGQPFTLTLGGCTGPCGYTWTLDVDPQALQLVAQRTRPPAVAQPGRSATQVYEFRAQVPGTHHLRAVLSRPWQSLAAQGATWQTWTVRAH